MGRGWGRAGGKKHTHRELLGRIDHSRLFLGEFGEKRTQSWEGAEEEVSGGDKLGIEPNWGR